MHAKGLYNLKLAQSMMKKGEAAGEIVGNDLDFDADHRLYILTGAKPGRKKRRSPRPVGIAFLLAQGGIYVPAGSFSFSPVDNIFTQLSRR